MASFKENTIIEKLNANNYSIWSFKMEMVLTKEDLFDTISEATPNPVTPEWLKKDRKAKAFISLFVENDQIVYIKSKETAKQIWDTLKGLHERCNLSSKLYLLRNLYSCKLPENGNMIKHITKILEIKDKLQSIGENINDSHLSALLLCSLPQSYDTLITALEARPEEELTPQFIQSKLTDEFNRRMGCSSTQENSAKAYKTQRKYTQNNYNYKKQNKFCTNCKLKSHNNSECWHLRNKSANNSSPNYQRNLKYKQVNSSLCFESKHDQRNNKGESKEHNNSKNEIETNTKKLNDLAFITGKTNENTWIIDSGSSAHISNDKNSFSELKYNDNSNVVIANGNILTSQGSGDIKIQTETGQGQINVITLKDVLYVPDFESNLLSVRRAAKNGCKIIFEDDKCWLNYNGKTYLEGEVKNNLYEVKLAKSAFNEYANKAVTCNSKDCVILWHNRLGHKNFSAMKEMIEKQLATGINIDFCKHEIICESCIKAKLTNKPYPKIASNRANRILQLVHTDICGPFRTPSLGGKSYFLTLIDDFSRYTIIYLLSHKSEVLEKFKHYISMVNTKFGKKPERIRSDNGKEYVNHEIEKLLNENGIKHELTVPYCPSQNGVAERRNRIITEMIRTMLAQANLPHRFWGEAVNTANYLINRLPTKSTGKTPYELWNKKRPELSHLKVFGCKAFAYIDKSKRGKLDHRAEEGIFVGYDYHSAGYRIYTGGKNIVIARTVKFLENKFISTTDESEGKMIEKEYPNENEHLNKQGISLEIELGDTSEKVSEPADNTIDQTRRSTRSNRGVPPDRLIYLAKHELIREPQNWSELQDINNPVEKQCWLKATQEEIKSLENNGTWTLVDPPQGKKVIGSKWLFKAKYDETGKVQKYKARLVAKGFLQKFGDDFDETFAPVVSFTTIRSFLSAAAYKNLEIHQLDVKTAFLHGDLDEEVYMLQPEGYVVPGEENKVCKLRKAIYGLKQAARAWNLKISESLRRLNFVQSTADSCLYVRNDSIGTSYVIIYVDDLLIAGNNEQIREIIQKLKNEYELRHLGQVNYYLGIKITRTDENNFELNQKLKIEEIVRKLNLENSKPTYIPMDPSYVKLEDSDKLLPNNTKYRQSIGALLYIATITRPDIMAAVNLLSRKCENPREKDWEALKRVVRYLNTTKELNLNISNKQPPVLTCYADADFAGDRYSRKSTSGNLFMLGKNPIQWITKRQSCVALSTAEAEYISVSSASQEIVWIVKLLEDLGLDQKLPIKVYEDNISCIKMVDSEKYSSRTKHIDIKFHYIKNLKETGTISLEYCPSNMMTADILTKPLPKPGFEKHRTDLQLLGSAWCEAQGEC